MTHLLSDAALLMRLRTRQLLLIDALGRERNLGRAAAALDMTQPAATKQLKQVEESMGVSLFARRARGMEPTPAGEIVIRFAQQALVDFGFAREQLSALRSGLHGTLRIGTVPGGLPQLLAPALVEFKRLHPRVAASVVVETSDVMLDLLERGQVDLVLGRPTEGHHDDELEIVPLLAEEQVVVARKGHPLLAARKPSLKDLARFPWVLQPPGSPQRGRFEAALRHAGVHGRLDITESASTVATTVLVEASDMLAIMPASLAGHYGRLGGLKIVRVRVPLQVPAVHLMMLRRRAPTPVAAVFISVLRGVAKVTGSRPAPG